MEYVFVLIVIAVLVCVLTGNLGYVFFGVIYFLLFLSVLLVITFLICSILLLDSLSVP